jgi:hypothetical protein
MTSLEQQQSSYEAIVRAEIAVQIMNKERGLVSERVATEDAIDATKNLSQAV